MKFCCTTLDCEGTSYDTNLLIIYILQEELNSTKVTQHRGVGDGITVRVPNRNNITPGYLVPYLTRNEESQSSKCEMKQASSSRNKY